MSDEGRGEATATGDSLISVPRSEDMGRIIGTKTPDAPSAQPAAVQLPSTGKLNEQAQPHGYDFKAYANEDNAARYDSFGAVAHAEGLSQKAVDALASWDQAQEAHAQKEYEANSEATFAALQQRWGPEFDANLKAVASYIRGYPASVQRALMHLAEISPDGTQTLLNWAKQKPIDVAEPRPAVDGERAKIEAMMADRRGPYWRGPDAERLQQRYRELIGGQPVQQPQESRDGRYERGDRRRSVPS
jgi:hypothetical protein